MNYRKKWYHIESLRSLWYRKAPVEIVTDCFPGLEPHERNIPDHYSAARQDVTLIDIEKRQENTIG
jgi:hypothetical protein